MNTIEKEIRECLCVNFALGLDEWLLQSGFGSPQERFDLFAELAESIQKIDVAVRFIQRIDRIPPPLSIRG